MGQRISAFIFLLSLCPLAAAADPKVASVVPAATDLIISMGAGDHLVGISNYDDASRKELKDLPKIGDYQTIDWERLRSLRPQILIIFQSPDRISPGVKERAAKLNLKLVNTRTETLSDIFTELKNLGEILNEQEKAAAAAKKLDTQLQSMRQRLRNLPPVKTLILRDETATATVGRKNFLNDILELAGGQNVIEDSGWPTLDHERLASLNPDAIIVLLSNVPPQVEKQAAANIARMTNLAAVKTNRVKIINLWYSQQPGLHLGDLADQFADFLHPEKEALNSPQEFKRRERRDAELFSPRPRTRKRGQGEGTSSSQSPQVTLINTDPRGVAGGTYSAPMRLRISPSLRISPRFFQTLKFHQDSD